MPINKALQGERTLVEPVYIWHLPQKKAFHKYPEEIKNIVLA